MIRAMMKKLIRLVMWTLCGVWLLPQYVYAYSWQENGEKLHYEVRLWVLKAGEAELVFKPNLDANSYQIEGKAWTKGVGSVVDVKDQIVSEGLLKMGNAPFLTQKSTLKLQENDYRAHKEIVYNQAENQAVYQNIHAGHNPEPYEMLPLSRDMLSALYYLRHQVEKIQVGQVYSLPVFDVNSQYNLKLKVVKQEKIQTNFGKKVAYLVTPSLEGVKVRNKKDRWGIWVSDDVSRIPYKISVKMNFGSFDAILKNYKSLGLNQNKVNETKE